MQEYALKRQLDAAKDQPGSAQPIPGGKAVPGMSNQAMLAFLSAMPKKRVPEEEGIRERLSEKFGVDFSGLKITRDFALGDIQERAYTRGNEIHLAPDVDTGSAEGQQILMHEAAHVIQQGTRSLSGGMLHDSALEAQANDIASGAGHIDVSNFSMPAAEGAPVQGFFGFFRRLRAEREKKRAERERERAENTAKANSYLPQMFSSDDKEFTALMVKSLEEHGFTDSATLNRELQAERFKAAANRITGGQTGTFRKPEWDEKRETSFSDLNRELEGGLPTESLGSQGDIRVYGVSQEELNGLYGLDINAYRSLIEKSNRAARIAAGMDWTRMSDREFLESFPLLRGISRLNVTAAQASPKIDADKDLARSGHKDLIDELDLGSKMVGRLLDYANARVYKLAGVMDNPQAIAEFAKEAKKLQQGYKERFMPEPKKPGLLSRFFGLFKRKRK